MPIKFAELFFLKSILVVCIYTDKFILSYKLFDKLHTKFIGLTFIFEAKL